MGRLDDCVLVLGCRREGEMMTDHDPASMSWHLDKRVPIALIVTIVLQTVGAVWFASALYARVEFLEQRVIASAPHSDRLTRVEVRIENIAESIGRIEHLIRQTPQRP